MTDVRTDRAYQLVNGFRAAQLVHLAAQLKIPDLLADGPRSALQLAEETGLDADRLRRALRGLAGLGVLVEHEDGCFSNSDVGELFREGVAGSQRDLALMLIPESYRSWDHFAETMRTGRTGQEIAHAGTLWDSMRRDPDFAERFNRAMAAGSERVSAFVASACDFAEASLIVDVGGGNGGLTAAILRAHPHLRAVISDLPAGLAGAAEFLAQWALMDRVSLVESDFFESVPRGGDVYLLKHIIHDWDDERSAQVLNVCRRAALPGTRILIVERTLPALVTDAPEHLNVVMTDLQMMVQLGSRERTEEQYRALLEQTGWRFRGSIREELYSVVEGLAS